MNLNRTIFSSSWWLFFIAALGLLVSLCFFLLLREGEKEVRFAQRLGCLDHLQSSAFLIGANAPECPTDGLAILPRTFPVQTLFLGYTNHPLHKSFVYEVLDALKDSDLSIAMLLARHEVNEAYDDLFSLKGCAKDRLQMITTPSDEALWAQDYFEVAVNGATGRPILLDLPYAAREGELIPAAISLTCDLELIRHPWSETEEEFEVGSGEYGGNIEAYPGELVLVGNNMTEELRDHLASLLNQTIQTVDVSWLETGHVDEVFALLPDYRKRTPCDFAIAYASPYLAFDLIQHHGFDAASENFSPPSLDDFDVVMGLRAEQIKHCLEQIAVTEIDQIAEEPCSHFVYANHVYANIINQDLKKLVAAIAERTKCGNIDLIDIPVLFMASQLQEDYGTGYDSSNAVNANAVNNILINDLLIIPRQEYPHFAEYVASRYEALGLNVVTVDADLAHHLSGGLHCLSNAIKVCRPRN